MAARESREGRSSAVACSSVNLFVIGAPKTGTSSVARWLQSHPKAFISEPKEPGFFCSDLAVKDVSSCAEYYDLFAGAPADCQIIGEASTSYLYSSVAVSKLIHAHPDARLIVGVRNPVDIAIALHNEEVRSFNEDIEDFISAWNAQDERRQGRRVPRHCRDRHLLLYKDRAMIGGQIEQVYRLVPKEKVMVYTFEELVNDPRKLYLRLIKFLGLPDDGRNIFEASNPRSDWRSKRLQKFLRILVGVRRRWLGGRRTGIGRVLSQINRGPPEESGTSAATRQMVYGALADDIEKLRDILKGQVDY